MEIIHQNPITYARLQLIWVIVGIALLAFVVYFSYEIYGRFSDAIYWANLAVLVVVLFMERGRGGMTAFFKWGVDKARSLQPSEFGKIAIIIALAKLFGNRKKPIATFQELLPVLVYIGLPLVLIVLQPDVGTALVYAAVFAVMLFLSGTNAKVIWTMILVVVILAVPLWYFMSSSEDSFRATRIAMWLDPFAYPDEARQVINGQIALGSGGFWGKGLVSVGSFASLNYISDDHTDFVFAIVGESFGMVGCMSVVIAYFVLMLLYIRHARKTTDPFGAYICIGVMAMQLFHVVENICMVIGLTPVTGIPLPFMSYGGSNYLSNILGVGLVLNVGMRSHQYAKPKERAHEVRI